MIYICILYTIKVPIQLPNSICLSVRILRLKYFYIQLRLTRDFVRACNNFANVHFIVGTKYNRHYNNNIILWPFIMAIIRVHFVFLRFIYYRWTESNARATMFFCHHIISTLFCAVVCMQMFCYCPESVVYLHLYDYMYTRGQLLAARVHNTMFISKSKSRR